MRFRGLAINRFSAKFALLCKAGRAHSGSLFYTYCKPLWGGIEVVVFILKIFAHGIMLIFVRVADALSFSA